jgi:hypothetical protein
MRPPYGDQAFFGIGGEMSLGLLSATTDEPFEPGTPGSAIRTVSVSLWLPVGRSNFFSVPEDRKLLDRAGASQAGQPAPLSCGATDFRDPPPLQVSMVRRILEVLPRSYGYDATGTYVNSDDAAEGKRAVSLTLGLRPARRPTPPLGSIEEDANSGLLAVQACDVSLSVDEQGYFMWTASAPSEVTEDDLRAALRQHVRAVVGGRFPLQAGRGGSLVRMADPLRAYKGGPSGSGSFPMGILTFFQINTVFEGLINETLTPAVFFENEEQLMTRQPGDLELRTAGGFVDLLLVDLPAALCERQRRIAALNHFLAVTSRESLQKLKWSVESVRRSLLDEMMGVLHRQSRLNQLNLGSVEPTLEQAVGANESQLRGYVMLVAAKLPLIANVERYAGNAVEHLAAEPGPVGKPGAIEAQFEDLKQQQLEWGRFVEALSDNIHGLESAIQHAWMERLLYEQEQVRSEQEAMAEIERSQNSRRSLLSADSVAGWGILVFTAMALVIAVEQSAPGRRASTVFSLWLPGLIGVGALIAAFTLPRWIRWRSERRGESDIYEYEFAFRLDLPAVDTLVRRYLGTSGRETVSQTGLADLTIRRRGGIRVEGITGDSTVVKLHSSLSFRPRRDGGPDLLLRVASRLPRFLKPRPARAHFEVITEILAHKVSDQKQYILRESRLFGDSQVALQPETVIELVTVALNATAGRILKDPLDISQFLTTAAPLFIPEPEEETLGQQPSAGEPAPGNPYPSAPDNEGPTSTAALSASANANPSKSA